MARQLLLVHHPSTHQIGFGSATLLLCAVALFMCASHSRKWRRWRGCCYGRSSLSSEPVIQINNEMTLLATEDVYGVQTTYGGSGDDELGGGGEVSIWRKNILMGGKCQIPEFSGIIVYDSEGNVVTPKAKGASRVAPSLNLK